ncbi:MAG: hypothetical protein ACLS9T_09910 [Streptococcus salivarius]
MSQMNLQREEVLEEKQTSLEDSSKITVLTNSSVTQALIKRQMILAKLTRINVIFLVPIKQGAMDGAKEGNPSIYHGS